MSRERLSVDMIRCSAHGMCAELLPERVSLDDWGYPMIDARPLDPELVSLARMAVQSCPKLALRLQREAARPAARARR